MSFMVGQDGWVEAGKAVVLAGAEEGLSCGAFVVSAGAREGLSCGAIVAEEFADAVSRLSLFFD